VPTTEGVAVVLLGQVRDQVARGWRVTVVCPDTEWLGDAARDAGARVVPWCARRDPGPSLVAEAVGLRRILRAERPDAVHLHSAKAGLVGRLVVRGRVPTIFQPHAWSFLAATGPLRHASLGWERLGARWTSRLVCVSEAELRDGRSVGIRGAATVVPNGVDLRRIRPVGTSGRATARAGLGLTDRPTAVCVGRLAAQKGQDSLIDAWPLVRERVPDARLVLVGDGPDRSRLEARAGSGVVFAGTRVDVPTWLAAADVVVVPSRWEAMALVPLEAMAAGRSVVATDVAGIAESMAPGTGAVVSPDRSDALAAAVGDRLLDPRLAAAEGRAGRAHVEARHDAVTAAGAVAELWRELAGAPRR
jgi:glycosyltransferase involved in cell wall biosynthesis